MEADFDILICDNCGNDADELFHVEYTDPRDGYNEQMEVCMVCLEKLGKWPPN